jgi:uncharacterized protein with PQ loop repeat
MTATSLLSRRALSLWLIYAILTQQHHIFEESSPFQRIPLDLHESDLKKLLISGQTILIYYDLTM